MTTSDTYSDGTDSQTVVSSGDYSTLSCVSNDFSGDYNQTTTDSSSPLSMSQATAATATVFL